MQALQPELMSWIGKSQTAPATLAVETARLMAATVDRAIELHTGDPLPPLWHWLYFHEPVPTAALGADGHARLGGFLPPIPLPRRMWAGGTIDFIKPLRLGAAAVRRSTVRAITPKEGRSGPLVFVDVEHAFVVDDAIVLRETQTLVYRPPSPGRQATSPTAPPAPSGAFQATHTPTPVSLFRYSALTFNSHLIHYDRDYCREHEGYPDLVVHGPLIATLLLDLVTQAWPSAAIAAFTYRAHAPLFAPTPFTCHADPTDDGATVWAAVEGGPVAMSGQVRWTR